MTEARDFYPAYKQERSRILANAACMLRCARQYGCVSHDRGAGYRETRKGDQVQLATLRQNWALVRASVAR